MHFFLGALRINPCQAEYFHVLHSIRVSTFRSWSGPNFLLVLILVQTVCKGYQKTTIVTPRKELVEISTISTSAGCKIHTHYYFSDLIWWVGSCGVAVPETIRSHETKSIVIRSFLAIHETWPDPSDQVTKVMMFLLYTYIKPITNSSV